MCHIVLRPVQFCFISFLVFFIYLLYIEILFPSLLFYLLIYMNNLYDTLFNQRDPPHTDDTHDIALEIINSLHGHTDLNNISNYYDLDGYNKLATHDTNKINILHINSRSLPKNIDNIIAFLATLSTTPDILAVTETWLTNINKQLHQLPGYHSYHLVRTNRAHGGVTIYISNKLQSQQIPDLTLINDDIEINTVEITSETLSFILCAIYRPHSKHELVEEFTNTLSALLRRDAATNKKLILIGDLNINLLEHTTHTPTNNFLATLQTLNFFPHISRPTRFPDTYNLGEPSLLDHIYTNFFHNFSSGIIHYQISDHLPIFLNITVPSRSNNLHKLEFRIFNQTNKQEFTQKIRMINWNAILSEHDVNDNCKIFLDNVNKTFENCFPIKSKRITEKRLNNPWITQAVINSIRTKNYLYKDYKIGAVTEAQYKQYRNVLNTTIRQAKKSYYMSIFTNFKSDTRKIWRTIHQLTHNNQKKSASNHIICNDKKLSEPSKIAQAFNEFYTNVAPKLDRSLPPSTTDPMSFLRGDYPHSMAIPIIIPQDVITVINSFKNKKCNIHEIPVSVIKTSKNQVAIPLTIIFNNSVSQGKFPLLFKHATVVPIHKKGPKDDISNYRPISLLNIFSKIFEKLMKKSLINFLESKNILNPSQFGFRRGLNTFDALRTFSEEIYSSLDSKHSLLSIFIDFTKAFDTVRHDILLRKLHFYGIRGIIQDWFRDYLSQRSQSTKFYNSVSTSLPIQYGVPQGSVLGPILFLLYINDITSIFTNLKTVLFADDSTLYITGENPSDIIHTANVDLQIFHKWCLSNRLTVNLNKTFYMLFTNKPPSVLPSLFFSQNIISRTHKHTLLGITYDDNMTFQHHVTNQILKLSRTVSLLYLIKELMPIYVLKMLYNAHVLPQLYYCAPIWCSTYPTHLLPLFRLQKKIIRIISNSDYFAHTQPLFKETNSLKLFDINKLQIGIYMYKKIKYDTSITLQPQHTHFTRTHENLRIPAHNLTLFQHSISYLGPKIWNLIPDNIKISPSVHSFKKQLKKYILFNY